MANMIKINRDKAYAWIKKVDILSSEGTVSLFCGTDSNNKLYLSAEIASTDETRQLEASVEASRVGKADVIQHVVVKAADFVSMAGEVIGYGNADKDKEITLEQKKGKLIISKDNIRLDIDILADSAVVLQKKEVERTVFVSQLYTADLLHLLKDCGRFYEADGSIETLRNLELICTDTSLSLAGGTRYIFGYDRVNCKVKHAAKWDEAAASYRQSFPNETNGVLIALPGIFAGILATALASTDKEMVVIMVDDRYLHLKFDELACISVRLTAKSQDFSKFKQIMTAQGEQEFCLDKSQLESAVRILSKKLNLSKEIGSGVPLRFCAGKNKNMVVSIADNRIEVPFVDGSVDGLDLFVLPKLIMDILTSVKTGNVLVKVVEYMKGKSVVMVGNGDVESGYADGTTKALAMIFDRESGEQAQARYLNGLTQEEAEKATKKEGEGA